MWKSETENSSFHLATFLVKKKPNKTKKKNMRKWFLQYKNHCLFVHSYCWWMLRCYLENVSKPFQVESEREKGFQTNFQAKLSLINSWNLNFNSQRLHPNNKRKSIEGKRMVLLIKSYKVYQTNLKVNLKAVFQGTIMSCRINYPL